MVEGSVQREFFAIVLTTMGLIVALAVSSFFNAWLSRRYQNQDPVKAKGVYALVAIVTYIVIVVLMYRFFFTPAVASPPELKVLTEEAEELVDQKRQERQAAKEQTAREQTAKEQAAAE